MNRTIVIAAVALALAGCSTRPHGAAMITPADGVGEEFAAHDAACRQQAVAQLGYGPARQAQEDQAVTTAIGIFGGAALGAITGGALGHPGIGTAIGVTSGAPMGLTSGYATGSAGYGLGVSGLQNLYDACMRGHGHTPATAGGAVTVNINN